MDEQGYIAKAYIAMAAIAGAITALAFRPWQKMTKGEIFLTLFVGFSFALFVTPWIAESVFGIAYNNLRVIAAITYVFASGSNILLPVIIRSFSRALGHEGKDNG